MIDMTDLFQKMECLLVIGGFVRSGDHVLNIA